MMSRSTDSVGGTARCDSDADSHPVGVHCCVAGVLDTLSVSTGTRGRRSSRLIEVKGDPVSVSEVPGLDPTVTVAANNFKDLLRNKFDGVAVSTTDKGDGPVGRTANVAILVSAEPVTSLSGLPDSVSQHFDHPSRGCRSSCISAPRRKCTSQNLRRPLASIGLPLTRSGRAGRPENRTLRGQRDCVAPSRHREASDFSQRRRHALGTRLKDLDRAGQSTNEGGRSRLVPTVWILLVRTVGRTRSIRQSLSPLDRNVRKNSDRPVQADTRITK